MLNYGGRWERLGEIDFLLEAWKGNGWIWGGKGILKIV